MRIMRIHEYQLKELAYELYKVDWENDHISLERKLAEYRLYCLTSLEDGDYGCYSFEDWLFDNGYDGELYVCFNEFLGAEYQDEDYMKYLLCENSVFWKAYLFYKENGGGVYESK